MGIDNAWIYDHNISYHTGQELMQRLEKIVGAPVFNSIYDFDKENASIQTPPDGFHGVDIETEFGKTIDDFVQEKLLIEGYFWDKGSVNGRFYMNPYVIDNDFNEAYLYRWQMTMEMCGSVREHGLRIFTDYDSMGIGKYDDSVYYFRERAANYPFLKKFGSTKRLTFCSDYHDEFIDHIGGQWTFEDFVSWGKKEFIYVERKDLPYFDFPQKEPDCYNVMIFDDMEDLAGSERVI